MLVITRRINETVVIDGNIRITVVAIQGGKVRLGITAPDDVRVDREEVHTRRMLEDVAEPEMVACPHGLGMR